MDPRAKSKGLSLLRDNLILTCCPLMDRALCLKREAYLGLNSLTHYLGPKETVLAGLRVLERLLIPLSSDEIVPLKMVDGHYILITSTHMQQM
ncbi:hypothetical protein CDAR_236761 [Caerostris darwini]|uniref:Uncharacterized protein n=1 Tax=Caerostris darwini TaxID=1538125 RepID=A0AAV4S6E2_9ARAC|nr:hypothetical protein CDAR_236761 [Caerostris darwini]